MGNDDTDMKPTKEMDKHADDAVLFSIYICYSTVCASFALAVEVEHKVFPIIFRPICP